MGCFDSVNAQCPQCHETVTFQSKAGACRLASYGVSSVPMEIAADLNGETKCCPKCDAVVKISIPPATSTRIVMIATVGDGTEWD